MDRKELDALIGELSDYLNEKIENEIEIRFVGGSAVCLYGGGTTLDVDFDFSSDKPTLMAHVLDEFFQKRNIPVDFSEDATGWWQVHVRKNRYSALMLKRVKRVVFKTAHPLEIIVKKLHRYYVKDVEDAIFLCKHFTITENDILNAIETAVMDSPISEQLFVFNRNIRHLRLLQNYVNISFCHFDQREKSFEINSLRFLTFVRNDIFGTFARASFYQNIFSGVVENRPL